MSGAENNPLLSLRDMLSASTPQSEAPTEPGARTLEEEIAAASLPPGTDQDLEKDWMVSPAVIAWLTGKQEVPPAELSSMMTSISNKLGYFIAIQQVKRFSNLHVLVNRLHLLEATLFSSAPGALSAPLNGPLQGMSRDQMLKEHKVISDSIFQTTEFARRFVTQAKDLVNLPEQDEVLKLVRSLDARGLKQLKQAVQKIAQGYSSKAEGSDVQQG